MQWSEWTLYGESLARALTAVMPETACSLFSVVMSGGNIPGADSIPAQGRWYRVPPGYFFIGPEGGDHHYQRELPPDVPPGEIQDAGIVADSRLLGELDQLLPEVKAAGAGEPVEMHTRGGQPLTLRASGDDLTALHALAGLLDGARDACRPGYNQSVTSQINSAVMEHLPAALGADDGPQAFLGLIRAGATSVLGLRWRCAADARLTALFFVQSRLCEMALEMLHSGQLSAFGVNRLFNMAIESRSVGNDPEQMLARLVTDFADAGLGDQIFTLCDEALSSADHEVEEALNAPDLATHAGHLYAAAHFAFADMRLAEVFRDQVAPNKRPAKATTEMLEGYARNAEETVVRAGHALVVGCINRGSGVALERHLAQIRAAHQEGGPDKAKARVETLIEDFYFYPRYYAKTLMEQALGPDGGAEPTK
ncbi:MAG: hypothetical protein M3Y28_02055 [Armatimonadota bacterium]|nr:hypothetical protein [Armatimonadota bacterium]